MNNNNSYFYKIGRVKLCFKRGKTFHTNVNSLRCRLFGIEKWFDIETNFKNYIDIAFLRCYIWIKF